MANNGRVESGTFKTSKFYVNWQIASQNIQENYSLINWQSGLYIGGYDEWYFNAVRINSVYINGQLVQGNSTYSNIKGAGNHQLASGQIRINHNNDGSKEFNINISGWLYDYGNTSGNGNFWLDNIPRQANITSTANSFTDESDFYFNFNNPLNLRMNAWLEVNPSGEHLAIREVRGTNGTFRFNLTEEERNKIRAKMPNSNAGTIRIGLYSYLGGTTFSSYVDKPFRIINANPLIIRAGIIGYYDINPMTSQLTQDTSIIIRNKSDLFIEVPDDSVTAQKGASISKYQITIAGETREFSNDIYDWGTLNLSKNAKAELRVFDSRGNYTPLEFEIKIADWEKPSANIALNRKNNYYTDTLIKVDALFSNVLNVNSLTIRVRYKKTNETKYSEYKTLQNNIQSTLMLDNMHEWDLQVVLQDKLTSVTYNLFLDKGMPIVFFDRNKRSVGINCFPTKENSLEFNGVDIGNNYSYDEIPIGRWVDNRIIYSKTIKFNVSTASNSINIKHNISNLDMCIGYKGFAKFTGSTRIMPVFYPLASDKRYDFAVYNVSSTDFTIVYGDWVKMYMNEDFYVTLEYVKKEV